MTKTVLTANTYFIVYKIMVSRRFTPHVNPAARPINLIFHKLHNHIYKRFDTNLYVNSVTDLLFNTACLSSEVILFNVIQYNNLIKFYNYIYHFIKRKSNF